MAEILHDHHNNKNGHGEEHVENPPRNLQVDDDDDKPMRDITNSHASFYPRGFYATLANFEIKGSLLANLPKFAGLASENSHKHLMGLYHTCSSMKPHTSTRMKCCSVFSNFLLRAKQRNGCLTFPLIMPH